MVLPREQSRIPQNRLGTAGIGSLAHPSAIKWCWTGGGQGSCPTGTGKTEQQPPEEGGRIEIHTSVFQLMQKSLQNHKKRSNSEQKVLSSHQVSKLQNHPHQVRESNRKAPNRNPDYNLEEGGHNLQVLHKNYRIQDDKLWLPELLKRPPAERGENRPNISIFHLPFFFFLQILSVLQPKELACVKKKKKKKSVGPSLFPIRYVRSKIKKEFGGI